MPEDSTPRGDEMVRRQPERKFPDNRPPAAHEEDEMGGAPHGSGRAQAREGGYRSSADTDIASRPSLPDRPEILAADVEDEDADPVVDSGPGIADGTSR